MFAQLAATISLALICAASPIVVIRDNNIKLPLSRNFNVPGGKTLPEIDRARAQSLIQKASSKSEVTKQASENVPVTNVATIYTVAVDVGTPPTTFNLIVDTGSSNTWVGANTNNPYTPTNSSIDTGDSVFVEYGSGLFIGEEYLDTVSFGDITLYNQSIGGSELALGFNGVDGIFGIGPVDLTEGTTDSGSAVPTVTDNALTAGLISKKQVGVYFQPTTEASVTNGELSFGGADSTKYNGTLNAVPITSTSPASNYFGVDQSVKYGDSEILSTNAGIVDTGTTLVLLATDAYNAYVNATGAVLDSTTGLLNITSAQYEKLDSLFFELGGVSYELTPNAQIWPRSLNTAIGGVDGAIYLVVADIGSNSGSGLDFINGYTFLERYYTVYDTDANTVSFAETPYTFATSN
ncbi:aspartic proteinase precursor [Irpex lacteus]|nr:aspartic proteinase precursor [Irpex lacteus]